MDKIIAISGPKDYYRIGKTLENKKEEFAKSLWYDAKKVADVQVERGDMVEFTSENKVLTSLKVTGKEPAVTTVKKEWRSKSPEESEGIRKQTVGKMVAESLKAMQGLTVDNIEGVIDKLFAKYDGKTR